MMDILEIIRGFLDQSGVTGLNDVPDGLLALALILGIIIVLRMIQKAVSSMIRLGCNVIGILVILWIVMSFF